MAAGPSCSRTGISVSLLLQCSSVSRNKKHHRQKSRKEHTNHLGTFTPFEWITSHASEWAKLHWLYVEVAFLLLLFLNLLFARWQSVHVCRVLSWGECLIALSASKQRRLKATKEKATGHSKISCYYLNNVDCKYVHIYLYVVGTCIWYNYIPSPSKSHCLLLHLRLVMRFCHGVLCLLALGHL